MEKVVLLLDIPLHVNGRRTYSYRLVKFAGSFEMARLLGTKIQRSLSRLMIHLLPKTRMQVLELGPRDWILLFFVLVCPALVWSGLVI